MSKSIVVSGPPAIGKTTVAKGLAKEFNLNQTLLFSKRDQKYFLLTALSYDFNTALDDLPYWKKKVLSPTLESFSSKLIGGK